jgi:hypothetical protein
MKTDVVMKVIVSFVLLLLITVCVCMSERMLPVMAQDTDTMTRKLWDTAFTGSTKRTANRRRAYRNATPNVPVNNVAPETVVGVTLWRLRPASRNESGERLIVHDNNASSEWVPERIGANTKLTQGDRLRISVEAVRSGFVYVINREQYADGSFSEPYLIFPTTRTGAGDNEVAMGRLLDIPYQDDSPPFFTMKKSRADHVAEVLSVIVAPSRLEGVKITDKALKLTDEQVASWEKAWGTSVGRMEMSTSGQAWTKEEKDARTRALTTSAPAPQLVFYRPSVKPSEPMFVKLRLAYGR